MALFTGHVVTTVLSDKNIATIFERFLLSKMSVQGKYAMVEVWLELGTKIFGVRKALGYS